jgi:hypothetical protein
MALLRPPDTARLLPECSSQSTAKTRYAPTVTRNFFTKGSIRKKHNLTRFGKLASRFAHTNSKYAMASDKDKSIHATHPETGDIANDTAERSKSDAEDHKSVDVIDTLSSRHADYVARRRRRSKC